MLLLAELSRNTHTVALFPLPSYEKVLQKILCSQLRAPNADCEDPRSAVRCCRNTVVRRHSQDRWRKSSQNFASRQQERFCQSCPEPFFGARIGVITNCNEPQDTWKLVLHGLALDRNQPLETSPWGKTKSKFGLKITFITFQVIIWNDDHHPPTPSFYEFSTNGPHTRSWQDIPIKHTQLQFELRLLQLSDHLLDKLKVFLTVADEGIKHLCSMPIRIIPRGDAHQLWSLWHAAVYRRDLQRLLGLLLLPS